MIPFLLVLERAVFTHHGDARKKIPAVSVQFPLNENIGRLLLFHKEIAHFSFLEHKIRQDRLHQRLDKDALTASILKTDEGVFSLMNIEPFIKNQSLVTVIGEVYDTDSTDLRHGLPPLISSESPAPGPL